MIKDSVKPESASTTVSGPRKREQINRSAMYKWQQNFWKALAEANYCWHWVTETIDESKYNRKRRVKRHVILGSEVNVAAVVVMGEYLTEVIERELPYENREALSKAALS